MLKAIIKRAREIFGCDESVFVAAHTGAAASNVGCGATTLASLFETMGDSDFAPASGEFLRAPQEQFAHCRLLIADEISMVGAQQFAAMSFRACEAKGTDTQFGNIGVVICGDFAQLRPIGQQTLIAPISSESSRAAAKLGNAGRRIFDTFRECVKFRVIYRQGAPCPFKSSTRRLRDFAMTLDDYELWKSRDIASDTRPADLKRRAESFIWLCEENAATGERNGEKLADLSRRTFSAIFRYSAVHNTAAASGYKPQEFKGPRANCHISVGAPALLISNKLFGVYTAPLGLMNGSRDTVVAISQGSSRPPHALPDYVAVDFPCYCGDPIFPEEGKEKWAPVPPVTVTGETKREASRTAIPLILCWAMTITRSQGLTLPECLVNLENKSGLPPLRSPGSAFVAWTRAVSMEGWACRMMPPFGRFLAGRFNAHHKLRAAYEAEMDEARDAFMRCRGFGPGEEEQAHLRHLRDRTLAQRSRHPNEGEINERLDMIRQRGILPIPNDVLCRIGKTTSAAVCQSDIAKTFREGRRLKLGSTRSDLSRRLLNPRRAGLQDDSARALPIPAKLFQSLDNGAASALGVPMGFAALRRAQGAGVTLSCSSTGSARTFEVESCASGTKGYLGMFSNKTMNTRWSDFAPFAVSAEDAAGRYAGFFPGYSVLPRSGRWEAVRMAVSRALSTPGTENARGGLPTTPLHDIVGLPKSRRGFLNEDVLATGRGGANRCFVIASAQALFSCEAFAQYLSDHFSRHAALCLPHREFRGVGSCYVCAMETARAAASSATPESVPQSEHDLWGGEPWSNADPITEGVSMQSTFHPRAQHSSDEYVERVIVLIGRTEAYISSLLSECTQSCGLEDGSHGGPYPQCGPCHRTPAAIRPPISFATLPLPPEGGVICEIQDIVGGRNVLQVPLDQNTGGCLSLLPSGALCDAPLSPPRPGWGEVGSGGALVLSLCRDGFADRGFQKKRSKIRRHETLAWRNETWIFRAAVSHIGDTMNSGHYVTIFALSSGGFMYASDGEVNGPMSLESAWRTIDEEPAILFYSKEGFA